MTKMISIIIPCYNCADTVEQAVASCFQGGLHNFEIIMVDDGSTDSTCEVMKMLANKHSEIKLFYHDKNRGGGAARNTGIKNSKGGLLFCLDADNVLDPISLQKMVDFLIERKIDGVAFHERRFFHSKSIKRYTSHFYSLLEKPITIDNLFDDSKILLDNFLYSRESFLRTTHYPEHHGFDTQSFEMRYLSVGNRIHICPGTFIFHRQNHNEPSYFEREFNKGNFSVNYYLAIEDIWNLFSPYAKEKIIKYDIFKNSSLQENLYIQLKKLYREHTLFISQKSQINLENNHYIEFDMFIEKYKQKKYSEALDVCKELLKNKIDSKIIYYSTLRASAGLAEKDSNSIEKEVSQIVEGLTANPRVLNKWYHRNLFISDSIQFVLRLLKKS